VRRGELIQINIDPSVLEDWGRELRRANGGKVGSRTPTTTRSPSWGSSSTPHALGADRGVRALPLRVRGGGWAAGPGLLRDKGIFNWLRIG